MSERYRALLAHAQSRQLVVALAAAWLSFGMVGLALFLVAHRVSGSSGLAGVVVAAFAIGSGVFAPLRGRLLDRRGARPWLLVFAAGYAVALAAAVLVPGTPLLVVCAAAGGASAPPLIASLRGLWAAAVGEALVRRAYALTSVVGDVGLVVGPALAGLLFVLRWWVPLTVCGVSAVAAALLVTRNAPRVPSRAAAAGAAARLLTPGFVVLLAVEVGLGLALGLVEVAVPAAAAAWHATAYSGLLLAAFAAGSVGGGLWFGRRGWQAAPERRYLVAALVLALGLLAPAVARGPAMLAPLLVVAGLAYGPATISLFEALDGLAASRSTEAFTWLTTCGAAGAAAGSAAGGWLGLWAAFATASAALGVVAGGGLLVERQRRLFEQPPLRDRAVDRIEDGTQ